MYRDRRDYKVGDKVPVVLGSKTIGHLNVAKLFPEESD